MYNIILKKISVEGCQIWYDLEFSDSIKRYFKSDRLFIEYSEDMSEVPNSILSIPFIATFLGISWLENCNIYVPELDETYYKSLFEAKVAFQEMYYNAHLFGRVVPCKIVQNEIEQSSDSLLLFGGGVDAHCSLLRHLDSVKEIINIQGWFCDIDQEDAKGALADKNHCEYVASRFRLKFNYVRSNFASIINSYHFNRKFGKVLADEWWHGIQHAMAFIAISMPIAYKHKISNLIISSSCTIGQQRPCGSFITTDSAYKFAQRGNVLHDAFELNRQQKVKVIADYQKVTNDEYLMKVCSFNNNNCCRCEKCFRTIIELIAEGADIRKFGFDIKRPLKEHWSRVMYEDLGLWGMAFERTIYWGDTQKRMKENYSYLSDEYKEFVDWFLTFDFDRAKKEGVRRYYKQNFFSIVKRKLRIR